MPKDQPSDIQADVVVANILSGPLRELAPVIKSLVKPQGLLALSGVLESQAQGVAESYADEIALDPVEVREEWCRLSGYKRA